MNQTSDTVLLAPHNDDETLFASFLAIRHEPDLVVCLRSAAQARYGVSDATRESETDLAWGTLRPGMPWRQWTGLDTDDNLAGPLEEGIARLARHYEKAIAPFPEPHGHPQHNLVGDLVLRHFGAVRSTLYRTYTMQRGGYGVRTVRSTSDRDVPFEPEWLHTKLIALTAYHSQFVIGSGSHVHFAESLREYLD